MQTDTSMRDFIWERQYATHSGETYLEGLDRVAHNVAKNGEGRAAYYDLMGSNRFLPGGRILAGAGSDHGNLLNCYVQDGNPNATPTARTLELATKLALVTAVGGGNGVNLDYLQPNRNYPRSTGQLYLTDRRHETWAEASLLTNGRYMDPVSGEYTSHGYRTSRVILPNVAAERGSLGAAIIEPTDSIEGIFTAAHQMVEELRTGRDVVVDLHLLRPEGASISGAGGSSSGPVSFAVEVFDNFAYWADLGAGASGPVNTLRYVFSPTLRVVKQGGVRRGAGMATLSVTHGAVNDFITAKDPAREKAEGDISTFNISVLATDQFISRAYDGEPQESATLNAIVEQAYLSGEPGVIFVDTVNGHNPLLNHYGPIMATNPCGEQPLYPGEPCNLGAINLAAHVIDGKLDYSLLEDTTVDAIHFLDDVLDAHKSPLPDIADAIERKRRIGLGVMGLADMLILLDERYDSPEGRETVNDTVRFITEVAIETSQRLGKERGIPSDCQLAGLDRRNIAVMTVAPTGTTSMLAGVSSGVEPVFSATYQRRVGNEYKTVRHPLADMPAFVTAHDIAANDHVRMQATVQEAFDLTANLRKTFAGSSISKTINLPFDAAPVDVRDLIIQAWATGCKGITVYRDGSRSLQVLTPVEEDVDDDYGYEAGYEHKDPESFKASFLDEAPVLNTDYAQLEVLGVSNPSQVPERGTQTYGRTHKYDVAGRKVYVTVNRNGDNQLVEVFINVGRPTDQERTAADIIGRLISLNLKHGAPVRDIVTHLSGHQDNTGGFVPGQGAFTSLWEAVARAISAEAEVRPDTSHLQDACPDCGSQLAREEGCLKCYSCGYSRCS